MNNNLVINYYMIINHTPIYKYTYYDKLVDIIVKKNIY